MRTRRCLLRTWRRRSRECTSRGTRARWRRSALRVRTENSAQRVNGWHRARLSEARESSHLARPRTGASSDLDAAQRPKPPASSERRQPGLVVATADADPEREMAAVGHQGRRRRPRHLVDGNCRTQARFSVQRCAEPDQMPELEAHRSILPAEGDPGARAEAAAAAGPVRAPPRRGGSGTC